jgi:DNA-binding NarL/FixJ family response regulator
MIRVLVCDDRVHTARRLATLLQTNPHVYSTEYVDNAQQLITHYGLQRADVVIVGIRRGTPFGVHAATQLARLDPGAHILAYGTAADARSLVETTSTITAGWLVCYPPQATLAPALTHALTGALTGASTSTVTPPTSPPPSRVSPVRDTDVSWLMGSQLTQRELEVLRGMSKGMTNVQIGQQLFLAEDTIKTHARRLFGKLGVRDRAHAVTIGFRTGLLS